MGRRHHSNPPPNETPYAPSFDDETIQTNYTSVLNDGQTSACLNPTDADYYYVKQKFGVCSIALSVLQILMLSIMMALCGVAPLEVNPTVGPYPDALSNWGGKNAYLIIQQFQPWRLLSSSLLHSGIIHLFGNVAVQLETGAFFEREWGSTRWIFIYLVSSLGSSLSSCCFNPDEISVGSSGPVMGLFGAKLSEVLSLSFFDTVRLDRDYGDNVRMEQLSGVLCSLAIVSLFTLFPFVEATSHVAGLATGFFFGMIVFSWYIRSWGFTLLWGGTGLLVTGFGFFFGFQLLFTVIEPNENLNDTCSYFASMHTENYDCSCLG